MVFTLPAVNAVKAAFPEARITYLVYKEFAPLLEGFPHIDGVITLDRAAYRGLNPRTLLPAAFRMLVDLRRHRFDLAVDFQGFGETGLLSWWTRAPQRWGSVYRATRGWAYTRGIPRDTGLHPIQYQLDMLQRSGGIPSRPLRNRFTVPESARDQALRFYSDRGLHADRPTLFVQPFTNWTSKNWPLERYLETARCWKQRGGQVLFGGGPGDRAALEPVLREGFVVAAGVPILVSAALANLATVVLGGDTGLLHLAVALGKRVVMIINSTSPGKCFPFEHPEWAVVAEDGANLSLIKPEAVIRACERALAERAAGAPHSVGERCAGETTS